MEVAMFKKYILNLIFLSVMLTFITTKVSIACDAKCYSNGYNQQIENFHTSEVLPQLLEWKTFLDNSLHRDDLTFLNKCRIEAKKIKQNINTLMKQKDSDGSHRKEQLKENFSKLKELALGLKPLTEKYRDAISIIANEMSTKSDEWNQKKQKICENICKRENESRSLSEKQCVKKNHCGNFYALKNNSQCFNKRKIAFFMLWDGSGNIAQPSNFDSDLFRIESIEKNNNEIQIKPVVPNPFTDIATIQIILNNPENLKISIIDQTGNIIKTLFDGRLEAGEHNFDFNAKQQNLTSGVYFYNIKSDNLIQTGKMIFINH